MDIAVDEAHRPAAARGWPQAVIPPASACRPVSAALTTF